MAIERRFIEENVKNATLDEYLAGTLQRAGYGGMDLKRSPLGTRIVVRIERPGLVIGRKGRSIKRLTEKVESKFNMENPQIEVEEIERPELNANVMASKLADSLEKGVNFRRAAYGTLRRMMEAGARGVEIVISGKITGGRSRSLRFADGYLKKCGNPAIEQVDSGYAIAKKKVGVLGVNVKIMPPDAVLPDEIEFIEPEPEEAAKPEPKRTPRKTPSDDKPHEKAKTKGEGEAEESPPIIEEKPSEKNTGKDKVKKKKKENVEEKKKVNAKEKIHVKKNTEKSKSKTERTSSHPPQKDTSGESTSTDDSSHTQSPSTAQSHSSGKEGTD